MVRPKIRAKRGLTIDKWRNPLRREPINLLTGPPDTVQCKKGIPIFNREFTDFKQVSLTSMTKYRPPPAPFQLPAIITEATKLHEMKSKFRFSLEGRFERKGDPFQREILQLCRKLELVGWVKCRAEFALGHLQGDVYALAYLKRWLDREETKNGRIDSVRFFDENYGIGSFQFTKLLALYDRRTPAKKKMHLLMLRSKLGSVRFKEESDKRNQEIERFFESHSVRNF